MPEVKCGGCGKRFHVIPARAESAKFCSYKCRGKIQAVRQRGMMNPKYRANVVRQKVCGGCGETFRHRHGQPVVSFLRQKFCTKSCADKHGFRFQGETHPNYKPDSRRKNRRGKHGAWARAVISRDHATCQRCGVTGVELHAHHIKSFAEFPALRWELSNGLTLCHHCHWLEHTVVNAKAVNSVDAVTGNADGNTEPSIGRKPVEGVTTSGRAYRRFEGHCEECGVFVSKQWNRVTNVKHVYCSSRCSGIAIRKRLGPVRKPKAVISATNAAPERDEIV